MNIYLLEIGLNLKFATIALMKDLTQLIRQMLSFIPVVISIGYHQVIISSSSLIKIILTRL